MFLIRLLLCLLPFLVCLPASADQLLDTGRTATIDFLLEQAMARNLIAGGVVLIGNHEGVLHWTARGRLSPTPLAPPLNDRTVFDVASLTKVLATTPAIMKLVEDGHINLLDPLTRWFPQFIGSGREDITVLNLLTHTSGLRDMTISSGEPLSSIIRNAALQAPWKPPGKHFRYADINFILLGELVRRVSGISLDHFCQEQIYTPLRAQETMFRPPPGLFAIAPTLTTAGDLATGSVQDNNARTLGGVAGHAGLFSSAADIARFARLILNGGQLEGQRILSEQSVTWMTAPYFYSNGNVVRGLGWDIRSSYSAPRGANFSDMSFGHTGYSGSSLWIDVRQDLFVVLLTIRLNYHDIRMFNGLRRDISTLAVSEFLKSVNSRQTETPQDSDLLMP